MRVWLLTFIKYLERGVHSSQQMLAQVPPSSLLMLSVTSLSYVKLVCVLRVNLGHRVTVLSMLLELIG